MDEEIGNRWYCPFRNVLLSVLLGCAHELTREYQVFFIRAAHVPMLIVAEGELAKQIMTKINVPKNQYKSIEKLVGKSSLLTSNPPDWTWKRKMINPAFHQTFLRNVVVSVAADTTLHVLNGDFLVLI
ncbi:hypothetical protein BKA69DRAFT_1101954 [Paraphysoderma sedebokerense]|nr:hypothetical protein BKA69DRAFT_1101954 [Paraphysoderma sedebokerense]